VILGLPFCFTDFQEQLFTFRQGIVSGGFYVYRVHLLALAQLMCQSKPTISKCFVLGSLFTTGVTSMDAGPTRQQSINISHFVITLFYLLSLPQTIFYATLLYVRGRRTWLIPLSEVIGIIIYIIHLNTELYH